MAHFLKKNWLGLLTAPMVRCPGIFLGFFTMLCLMPLITGYNIAETLRQYIFDYILQSLAQPIVLSWIAASVYLLLGLWKRWVAILWLILCCSIFYLNFLIDYFVVVIYHDVIRDDIAAVLCATNPAEGYNFFSAYLPSTYGMLIVYTTIFIASFFIGKYVGRFLISRFRRFAIPVRFVIFAVLLLSWIGCFTKCVGFVHGLRFTSKFQVFSHFDHGHDLVPVNPRLVTDEAFGPTKLVVVIGESHCRSHSSLYGYRRQTQPRQEKLVADSSLYVFHGAVAPAYYTLDSFKRFIGTWNGEENRKWYEQFTFLEAARLSGYRLLWYSTQSSKGAFDNVVVKISNFCDVVDFSNDGMKGGYSGTLDELIFKPLDKDFNSDKREFIVLHLMGSHPDYDLRYPESFSVFKEDDYPELPDNQRKIVSCYDNSVLYNDYILSEIYRRFDDTDAVIVYFSDHAQDLFETRPDFFGHAILSSPESIETAKKIPFTIYLTERYKSQHTLMASRIAKAAKGNGPVYTTDIIYSLMDLMGTRFADNDDVASKSIFPAPTSR